MALAVVLTTLAFTMVTPHHASAMGAWGAVTAYGQYLQGIEKEHQASRQHQGSTLTYLNAQTPLSAYQLSALEDRLRQGDSLVIDGTESSPESIQSISALLGGVGLYGDVVMIRKTGNAPAHYKQVFSASAPSASAQQLALETWMLHQQWIRQALTPIQRKVTANGWRPESSIHIELRQINLPCLVGNQLEGSLSSPVRWTGGFVDACDRRASVSLMYTVDFIRSIASTAHGTEDSKYIRITIDPESQGGAGWHLVDKPRHKHTWFQSWANRTTWFGPIADHYGIAIHSHDPHVRLHHAIPASTPIRSFIRAKTTVKVSVAGRVTLSPDQLLGTRETEDEGRFDTEEVADEAILDDEQLPPLIEIGSYEHEAEDESPLSPVENDLEDLPLVTQRPYSRASSDVDDSSITSEVSDIDIDDLKHKINNPELPTREEIAPIREEFQPIIDENLLASTFDTIEEDKVTDQFTSTKHAEPLTDWEKLVAQHLPAGGYGSDTDSDDAGGFGSDSDAGGYSSGSDAGGYGSDSDDAGGFGSDSDSDGAVASGSITPYDSATPESSDDEREPRSLKQKRSTSGLFSQRAAFPARRTAALLPLGSYYSARSVSYKNHEYVVSNQSRSQRSDTAAWTWNRSFDTYSHEWRTHGSCALFCQDWFFNDEKFSGLAYTHFTPGFSATFRVPASKTDISRFYFEATVKPVALAGHIRYSGLFQDYSVWDQKGLAHRLTQVLTVNWGSHAFQKHPPLSLEVMRKDSPKGLCLNVKESGTHEGTAVNTFRCHYKTNQLWHYDGLNRLHTLVGPDRCLTSGADDTVSVRECTQAPTQKWTFHDNRLTNQAGSHLGALPEGKVRHQAQPSADTSWQFFVQQPLHKDVLSISLESDSYEGH